MNFRRKMCSINILEHRYVDENALSAEDRKVFLNRLEALRLISSGVTGKEVYRLTGISSDEQTRYSKRFLRSDENGSLWGDRVCVPNFRIEEYTRTAPFKPKRTQQQGSLSGIFRLTLKKYPQVEQEFIREIRLHHTKYKGVRFVKSLYYVRFLKLLEEAGATEDEWPFNISSGGRNTILGYIDELLASNFVMASLTLGVKGETHARLGAGKEALIEAKLPFDIVELDAYKTDAVCIVRAEPLPGIYVPRVVDRFWLLAVVERISRGILAARFVFSSEIRAQDVEDLIIEAFLGSWQPNPEIKIEGLEYPPGAGMIGYILPCTKGVLWGALYLDNAAAHHANKIKSKLRDNIGFAINYGQLKHPERRAIVENTFGQIAQKVMHRLPSTTGSHPGEGRAENPEKQAERYEIFVDEAEQLLDVWMATYNITPKSGATFSRSPKEIIEGFYSNKKLNLIFPRADASILNSVYLSQDVRYCIVRGSAESGVAPHIRLDKADYTNEKLSARLEYVGLTLLVKINPKDYRAVEAILPNGESLGKLTVLGYWRKTPHSVVTRQLINRAFKDRNFEVSRPDDIVLSFLDHLNKKLSKRGMRDLVREYRELENALAGAPEELGGESEEPCDTPGDNEQICSIRIERSGVASSMRGDYHNIPGGLIDESD